MHEKDGLFGELVRTDVEDKAHIEQQDTASLQQELSEQDRLSGELDAAFRNNRVKIIG